MVKVKITSLMDDYWSWIKNDTEIRGINDWHEITTPFLDRHNDVIRIYEKSDGDSIQLTDDGYTINDLEISGCEVHTPKRREILESMLNGFGVKLEGKELRVTSPRREFIKDKHNFLQAILAVDNFFSSAHSQSSSLFFDDVQEWLNSIPVKSTRNRKFDSKLGLDYIFDFVITKGDNTREHLLKLISYPDRYSIHNVLLSWDDTSPRAPGSQLYAILNDMDINISKSVEAELNTHHIRSVRWTEKEKIIKELTV